MSAVQPVLKTRDLAFGGWTSLGHPSITEMLAGAGVGFIGIDLEHSTISQEQAQRIIAAAQSHGVACLPRVSSHNGEQIKRLLDSGADGIIVPSVSTRAEAEQLIAWCKYPPVGRRSYGVSRAQGYGAGFSRYVQAWNERSTLIVQIESTEGVTAVDEVLAHEAVDGAMVGPYDISGSLGIPGQLEHPKVTAACRRVVEACRKRGKACGTQVVDPTPERVAEAIAQGYTFIILASDVFILWKWAERMQALVAQQRSGGSSRAPVRSRAAAGKRR